ncbi:MAG: hypothetical protein AAGJ72_20350, partial [Pseudomonadota bacterium]
IVLNSFTVFSIGVDLTQTTPIEIGSYIPFILKLIMKLENKREGNQIWFNFAIKKRLCARAPAITLLLT